MAKQDGKCAAKIAAKKEKIAAKIGKKAAKALTLAIALGCFAGCATSDPSSRSTSGKYGDTEPSVKIVFERDSHNNTATITMPITMGDAAVASSDSAGSTETTTATPTNTTDIKPKTDVNTTGGRTAGVLESIVGAFGTWLTTPSGKEATTNAANACPNGNCTTGTCTDGSCSDGSCSECTLK